MWKGQKIKKKKWNVNGKEIWFTKSVADLCHRKTTGDLLNAFVVKKKKKFSCRSTVGFALRSLIRFFFCSFRLYFDYSIVLITSFFRVKYQNVILQEKGNPSGKQAFGIRC